MESRSPTHRSEHLAEILCLLLLAASVALYATGLMVACAVTCSVLLVTLASLHATHLWQRFGR